METIKVYKYGNLYSLDDPRGWPMPEDAPAEIMESLSRVDVEEHTLYVQEGVEFDGTKFSVRLNVAIELGLVKII